MCNSTDPRDIHFSPEEAATIAADLFTDAFSSPRDKRSEEYKDGFRAAAFNNLIVLNNTNLLRKASFPRGSCQHDAWLSGYDEGRIAARSFQIQYLEGQHGQRTVVESDTEDEFMGEELSFVFD
jgi:hypothetical protein